MKPIHYFIPAGPLKMNRFLRGPMPFFKSARRFTDKETAMATKIHYEDNIFYLETLLKTVKKGISLQIDVEYFREKMLEDIFFLGSSLGRMYASLKTNSHLIKKTDYLRSLLRAKRDFTELVESILEKKLPLAASLEAGFPRLKICRAEQAQDIGEIRAHLENSAREEAACRSDVISGEEFRFLLRPASEGEAQN
jgi:hypothetical protein